jgi:hypothetical protein
MSLPKTSPQEFCTAFIVRELKDFKEKRIWTSALPIMQRMIDRSDELKQVFDELVAAFGYSDKFEGVPPSNTYIWLTLEHIWLSSQYAKEGIIEARQHLKKLNILGDEIVELSWQLASALREHAELYEKSEFIGKEFRSLIDTIQDAGSNNYHFKFEVSDELRILDGQYDERYWPSCADIVEQIGNYQSEMKELTHMSLPLNVIDGRASDIKDFVLGFDSKFTQLNGLPSEFSFSNNAMAEIINVVLDLPVEQLVSADAIRLVRNRYK